MSKVDPWVWFWPCLILLNVYGCQQEHLIALKSGKPSTAYTAGEEAGKKIKEVLE